MQVELGIDIVNVKRMKQLIQKQGDTFLLRLFSDEEIAYCRERRRHAYESFAARFAAKEACIKAFGGTQASLTYKDIVVRNNADGRPSLSVAADILRRFNVEGISVSLSHEKEFAVASVCVMRKDA